MRMLKTLTILTLLTLISCNQPVPNTTTKSYKTCLCVTKLQTEIITPEGADYDCLDEQGRLNYINFDQRQLRHYENAISNISGAVICKRGYDVFGNQLLDGYGVWLYESDIERLLTH